MFKLYVCVCASPRSVCCTCGLWRSTTLTPFSFYEAITSADTSQSTSPSNRSVSRRGVAHCFASSFESTPGLGKVFDDMVYVDGKCEQELYNKWCLWSSDVFTFYLKWILKPRKRVRAIKRKRWIQQGVFFFWLLFLGQFCGGALWKRQKKLWINLKKQQFLRKIWKSWKLRILCIFSKG